VRHEVHARGRGRALGNPESAFISDRTLCVTHDEREEREPRGAHPADTRFEDDADTPNPTHTGARAPYHYERTSGRC
jgi:hypothetical protein